MPERQRNAVREQNVIAIDVINDAKLVYFAGALLQSLFFEKVTFSKNVSSKNKTRFV